MKHIFNRHYKKKKIFCDMQDVERFRKLIFECSNRYRVKVESYAIMDNHFHLLVDADDLGKFMMSVQRGYAQYFNRRYKERGRVFEKTYKSKPIETFRYLKNMQKYILLNPIDRSLEVEIRGMISNSIGF